MANVLDISLNISIEYAIKAINILVVHLPPLHSD